jgi:hypothetical protein
MTDGGAQIATVTRPRQDRISVARAKLDRLNGGYQLAAEKIAQKRREVFNGAKIPGRISMLQGGGAAALEILIETENGWIVSVRLSPAEAHRVAELIASSVRKP